MESRLSEDKDNSKYSLLSKLFKLIIHNQDVKNINNPMLR